MILVLLAILILAVGSLVRDGGECLCRNVLINNYKEGTCK